MDVKVEKRLRVWSVVICVQLVVLLSLSFLMHYMSCWCKVFHQIKWAGNLPPIFPTQSWISFSRHVFEVVHSLDIFRDDYLALSFSCSFWIWCWAKCQPLGGQVWRVVVWYLKRYLFITKFDLTSNCLYDLYIFSRNFVFFLTIAY